MLESNKKFAMNKILIILEISTTVIKRWIYFYAYKSKLLETRVQNFIKISSDDLSLINFIINF